LVDLDGDGHVDLLSGSWPGELFLFRGGAGRAFAAPEMLKDRQGNIINIGGGIAEQPDGILITGHGEFEQTPEGTFVNYHGKRIKNTEEKPISVTGTASVAHAADWDGDGDLDVIVGDIWGAVYMIPNEGTRTALAFGKEAQLQAGGQPLAVEGDAGPFIVDWDGDGDLDLLVGAGDGSVSLFRNKGTARKPELSAGEKVISAVELASDDKAPSKPQRGIRAKVCAADWNGDGRLDLLVGDFATQKPDLPAPTAAEAAEHERLRKELAPLEERCGQLMGTLFGKPRVTGKEREDLEKETTALTEKIENLRSKIPPESENHGWVWLFLRKSAGIAREF
jgi:hypothetical protein